MLIFTNVDLLAVKFYTLAHTKLVNLKHTKYSYKGFELKTIIFSNVLIYVLYR